MNRFQEPKYEAIGGKLVNRETGEPIPDDEPVFILRAKDVHAEGAILFYAAQVSDDNHCRVAQRRAYDFMEFRKAHPERMSEPDSQDLDEMFAEEVGDD